MSEPITSDGAIARYYRFHARIYDLTRWSFLFGRQAILRLAATAGPRRRILEVGCGTGRNLPGLLRLFPEAQVTALDLSPEMLAIARRKTAADAGRMRFLQQPYTGLAAAGDQPYDLVLFSYALTMFNPGWREAIAAAAADLAPGGIVAVADFHDSPVGAYKRWMWVNHVRMDAHLLPVLEEHLEPCVCQVRRAYGGVWRYLLFVGRQRRTGG